MIYVCKYHTHTHTHNTHTHTAAEGEPLLTLLLRTPMLERAIPEVRKSVKKDLVLRQKRDLISSS